MLVSHRIPAFICHVCDRFHIHEYCLITSYQRVFDFLLETGNDEENYHFPDSFIHGRYPGLRLYQSGDTGIPVPGTTVPATPSTVVPVTTATTPGPLSEITPVSPGLPGDAITTVATTRIASDNPYLEYLNVRKRTFADPLPNCLMGVAFPFTKNETGYGIQQNAPKLTAISEDEYLSFLRRYTQGNAESTP